MPFASFKNIQKRNARIHKERSQPAARAKLGLLPKKKDFILRSKDDEKKRNKIKELRIKASSKNPDEFYFAMHNTKFSVDKGHIPMNNENEYNDVVLTEMLAQDLAYLNRELQIEKSKIKDLESRLNLLPADPSVTSKRLGPKRTVFVESIDEARQMKSSLESSAPTRLVANIRTADIDAISSMLKTGYSELSDRLNRAEKLNLAIQKRTAKNNLMHNRGVPYKVESKATTNHPPIFKFQTRRYK